MHVLAKWFMIFICNVSFFSLSLFGITTTGSLTGIENWSGTVTITGDLLVYGSLTIQPGTIVEFNTVNDNIIAGSSNQINLVIMPGGSFKAEGDNYNRIRFKSASTFPYPGIWGTIRIAGSGSGAIAACDIEYPLNGVVLENGSLLHVTGNSNLNISDCRIINSYSTGIFVGEGNRATITQCFFNSCGKGVFASGSPYVGIFQSTIYHSSNALICHGKDTYTTVVEMDHCTIYDIDSLYTTSTRSMSWDGYGIFCIGTGYSLKLSNSILYQSSNANLKADAWDVDEHHNCFYTGTTGRMNYEDGVLDTANGSFEADPLFLDAPVSYVLQSTSPCVGAASDSTDIGAHIPKVIAPNNAPSITSSPIDTAIVGSLYTYPVIASDPDSDNILHYSLLLAPEGMVIDSLAGILSWVPEVRHIGVNYVKLSVDDGNSGVDSQAFAVNVDSSQARVQRPSITESLDGWVTGAHKPVVLNGERGDGTNGAYLHVSDGVDPFYYNVPVAGEGSVTFWVYDGGACLEDYNPGYNNKGPMWGVLTGTNEAFCVGVGRATYVAGCQGYSPWCSLQPTMFYWFWDGLRASHNVTWHADWYKWTVRATMDEITFTLHDVVHNEVQGAPHNDLVFGDVSVTFDAASAYGNWAGAFGNGVKGIYFAGDESYVEDIKCQVVDGTGVFSGIAPGEKSNTTPVITSVPETLVAAGDTFSYTVVANDPDSAALLIYFLIDKPNGMTINSQTGTITWRTYLGYEGDTEQVVVGVKDETGDGVSQTFLVTVGEPHSGIRYYGVERTYGMGVGNRTFYDINGCKVMAVIPGIYFYYDNGVFKKVLVK